MITLVELVYYCIDYILIKYYIGIVPGLQRVQLKYIMI